MSKAIVGTKLLITWLAFSLLAIGCSGHSVGDATEQKGTVEMALATTVRGVNYRLAKVSLFISGPSFQSVNESEPDETKISATLNTGNYSIFLEQWELQRSDDQGMFQPVQATLESGSSQTFTIYNGATTTIAYSFLTDGVTVVMGSGHLDVLVHVDVADAACTPLGGDCASGSWCPPASLTGADIQCVPAGSTPLGQPCQRPTQCVANASCFASSSGTICTALCSSSQFNQRCSAGGVCRPVTTEYGVCDGAGTPIGTDAGTPIDGSTDVVTSIDGGTDVVTPHDTEGILASRGATCLACVRDNGCLDPAQLGGTCENPPSGAHGSLDGTRTYGEMCLQTLSDIFASGCAATMQLTPCLCGTTDAGQCLAGIAPPNGPIDPDYVADFGTFGAILTSFIDPTFGAGQANSIVQCAGAFSCECF